jgi:hypothetical protein
MIPMIQAGMLQDPYTLDKLQLTPAGAVNPESGQHYPCRDGFFAFLTEAAAEGSNKKYLELYDRIARFYRLSNKIYFALKFGGERRQRRCREFWDLFRLICWRSNIRKSAKA